LYSDLLPFVVSNFGMFREHTSFFATIHCVLIFFPQQLV
jgi:hypothetical protein